MKPSTRKKRRVDPRVCKHRNLGPFMRISSFNIVYGLNCQNCYREVKEGDRLILKPKK